ncbi:MAG: hypothetical protein P4N59_17730 [Negativicutes bacterium]|nr:hypothetical protein [Negativicutes bacterium]
MGRGDVCFPQTDHSGGRQDYDRLQRRAGVFRAAGAWRDIGQVAKMDIPEGVSRWTTPQGVTVVRVHFTADEAKRSAAWQAQQKKGMSEAMWEREMEINFHVSLGKAWFPEFRFEVHVAKGPLAPIRGKTIVRGWDYGLTPCTVFAQFGPKGELVVLKEIQSVDCGVTAHARVVQAESMSFAGYSFVDIGDPAGRQRSQSDETSCADILRDKYGIYVQDGPVSAVKRWEAVRTRLTTVTETGGPMLLLDPGCKWLIGGFTGGYHRRKIGERYLEEPDKNEYSHTQDALAYIAAGSAGTERKWEDADIPRAGRM